MSRHPAPEAVLRALVIFSADEVDYGQPSRTLAGAFTQFRATEGFAMFSFRPVDSDSAPEASSDTTLPTQSVSASRLPVLSDFRGKSLLALIAASVLMGVVLSAGGLWLLRAWERRSFADAQLEFATQSPRPTTGERLGTVTLRGPDAIVTLPPGEPSIVNVWLEGCRDCMPAFEAWRDLRDALPRDSPIINIAYGKADTAWARQWRTDDRLVFDSGSHVVRPLGIDSFTTLVVNADGNIVFRDRPDGPGFAQRMRGALNALRGLGTEPSDEQLRAPLLAAREQLRACLLRFGDAPPPSAVECTLSIRVQPDGTPSALSIEGALAPEAHACLQEFLGLMRWPKFSGEPREIHVPLALRGAPHEP